MKKVIYINFMMKKMMILCANTYFGQDEILENSKRVSQAKVFSQTCDLFRIQKNVKLTFKHLFLIFY